MAEPTYEAHYRRVRDVFGPEPMDLGARIARLFVLYEDLRIEAASAARAFEVRQDYEALYFVRRSICTLVEFAEAVRLLDETAEFRLFKASLSDADRSTWHAAHDFLKDHEAELERVRNNIGGHFGEAAARFAIEDGHSDKEVHAFGIERARAGASQQVRVKISLGIVKNALFKERGEMRDSQYLEHLFTLASDAFREATRAVHVVMDRWLAPRYGFTATERPRQ